MNMSSSSVRREDSLSSHWDTRLEEVGCRGDLGKGNVEESLLVFGGVTNRGWTNLDSSRMSLSLSPPPERPVSMPNCSRDLYALTRFCLDFLNFLLD